MKKLIISTVGTSLITNPASKDDQRILYNYSNYTEEETPNDIINKVNLLYPEALKNINDNPKRASAELNGVLGIYKNIDNKDKQDIHFLITTDTFQGKKSAELVKDYFTKQGIKSEIYVAHSLSAKNKESFSEGVKNILKWCDETLPGYNSHGYKIIFNLTGGFKGLQGFMNTIAMFYADKITYIFEAQSGELIEIPKLPIQIDKSVFEKHKKELLLLNNNKIYTAEDLIDIPESLLDKINGNVIFSVWGELLWNQIKYDLFNEIPKLPYIKYETGFIKKYSQLVDKKLKMNLLETIAKISVLIEEKDGDTSGLSKGGIQYSPLKSKIFKNKPLYHFRTNLGIRVNCIADDGLLLTEFGTHDETQT